MFNVKLDFILILDCVNYVVQTVLPVKVVLIVLNALSDIMLILVHVLDVQLVVCLVIKVEAVHNVDKVII